MRKIEPLEEDILISKFLELSVNDQYQYIYDHSIITNNPLYWIGKTPFIVHCMNLAFLPKIQFDEHVNFIPGFIKINELLDKYVPDNHGIITLYKWYISPHKKLIHQGKELTPIEWLRNRLDYSMLENLFLTGEYGNSLS